MRNARVLRCPNCGGTVDERARHCAYCSAPVATVRCGRCFHMNIPDAVHCSGCGWALGLEPASEPDFLKCPRCRIDFDFFRGNRGKLHDCSRCGGQFVEHLLLRDLIERRDVYGAVAPRLVKKSNPLDDPVRYVPCPECRSLMSRRNFGGASGVIVDICAPHGIWFDAGELPLVLEFVEAGGLAAARRREREEAEQKDAEQRREVMLAPLSPRSTHERSPSGHEVVASVVASLLEYLASLLPDARH